MTTVTLSCLTPTLSSSSPLSPPFPSTSKTTISHLKNPNSFISRRQSSLLLSITPFLLNLSSPASAINIGISGPKDWLKEQKKKAIKYVLAPIEASDEILRYAYQLLLAKDTSFEQKDLEEFRGLLKSAARDCVARDRNSLVAFQAKTGVEVCTFKLILSNASSLLDDGDPTKLEAEAKLSNLVRSFTVLNDVAKEVDFQVVANREKLASAVMDSLSSLHKFEQGIKECIGV